MTKLSSTSGAGIAIGMGIGVALGAAIDNWGVGIALGAALGLTVFRNVGKDRPVAVEEKEEAPLDEETHDSSSDEEE